MLFILLNGFADWEGLYLAVALNNGVMPVHLFYETKVVAPTLKKVRSIGGF